MYNPSLPSAALSPSPHSASSYCSISALRDEFEPFPFRPAGRTKLSFVSLGVEGGGKAIPESIGGEVVVRAMKRVDVEEVKRLQVRLFLSVPLSSTHLVLQDDCLPVSYPPSFYSLLLSNPSSLCLVAYSLSSPSTLLGSVSANISFPLASSLTSSSTHTPPVVYILSLAVSPAARNQGLASHLLHAVTKALLPRPVFHGFRQKATVRLHVEAGNEAAIRLYKKVGLSEKGRVRGHYRRVGGGGSGEAVEMEGLLVV
jgi:ribosomal protein S18 acetylase RimI-like enzyme